MNLFKKSVSMLLALTLLVSLVAPSFAESTIPKYLEGKAVVKEVFEKDSLLVTIDDMELVLNVSDETMVLDSKTGLMGYLKDLNVGDLVYAYYSPAMTRSLPPQSFASVIITGIEEDKAHARLFTVKEVMSSKDEGVTLLNEEGDLVARISKDTPFSPFRTKQIVKLQDIKVGTQLFLWYELVALSYPGQTNADKAVFIGQSIEDVDLGVKPVLVPKNSDFTEKISINDKIIDLGKYKWHGQENHVMVPLRLVSEALGFKVTWDSNLRGAYLDNGSVKTTVILGKDGYFKASSKALGLTQTFEFGAKPVLIDDRMFVPVELFNLLYSNNNAVKLIK